MPAQTDAIIRRVLEGDTDAYADIVDAFQQDVWKVVVSYIRDRSQAEDLVQSAFVKAYFALESFRAGGNFGAWLKAIARNEVRMALRKSLSHPECVLAFADQVAVESAMSELERDRAEQMETFLGECLEDLPAPLRGLLETRYGARRHIAKLAEETSRSIDTVKKALVKARGLLKRCIEAKVALNA